jgi:hypothetical protein
MRHFFQFGFQLFLHVLIAVADGKVVFHLFPGAAGQLARRQLRQREVNLLMLKNIGLPVLVYFRIPP